MASGTDRIEKRVFLKAPRERVWRAISDAKEFGRWFGVRFEEPFAAGRRMAARIVPTTVDAAVAKTQQPYEGITFDLWIERIEPPRLFSFRWHPGAVDPKVDYAKEPTTLVEFTLEEAPGGTMLTLSESGFDAIPLARRAQAFEGNKAGWETQVALIAKYLAARKG